MCNSQYQVRSICTCNPPLPFESCTWLARATNTICTSKTWLLRARARWNYHEGTRGLQGHRLPSSVYERGGRVWNRCPLESRTRSYPELQKQCTRDHGDWTKQTSRPNPEVWDFAVFFLFFGRFLFPNEVRRPRVYQYVGQFNSDSVQFVYWPVQLIYCQIMHHQFLCELSATWWSTAAWGKVRAWLWDDTGLG